MYGRVSHHNLSRVETFVGIHPKHQALGGMVRLSLPPFFGQAGCARVRRLRRLFEQCALVSAKHTLFKVTFNSILCTVVCLLPIKVSTAPIVRLRTTWGP